MIETVEILSHAQTARWQEAVRDLSLPSLSWHHAHALSACGIKPQLAEVRCGQSRLVFVFFERRWHGVTDIATIPGLSGAYLTPGSADALRLWHEYACAQNWLTGYLQIAVDYPARTLDIYGEIRTGQSVFRLDLAADGWLGKASEMIRRKVAAAERSSTAQVEDTAELSDALQRLYPATMRRVATPPRFQFTATALERWAQAPDCLILGGRVKGVVKAVSLFQFAGSRAEYNINVCTEDGQFLAAWLIWQASLELAERGVRTLNLGGGVKPQDGLHYFKERFNGREMPLQALCQIYDSERYQSICQNLGNQTNDAFFPAYAAPDGGLAASAAGK